MESSARSNDEHGDVLGLIAGGGILLMQAAALIPGLLPVLLLLLPVVLPLVVLGIAGGVLVGVPLGLWRLGLEPRFQGRGLGHELVAAALRSARERGLEVLPFCPYVRGFIAKHPEFVDLVPEQDRPAPRPLIALRVWVRDSRLVGVQTRSLLTLAVCR